MANLPRLAVRFASQAGMPGFNRGKRRLPERSHLQNLLPEISAHLNVTAADRERIPASGPVVVLANQPATALGTAILTALFTRVRPDVKILTNLLLSDAPEILQHCIFAGPFRPNRVAAARKQALGEAHSWVQRGGLLAICHLQPVANWKPGKAPTALSSWNDDVLRLIRETSASILPIYFSDNASLRWLRVVHSHRSAASLLQEFLRQERKGVEIRVGSKITAEVIAAIPDGHDAIQYLRWRASLLGRRSKRAASRHQTLRSRFASKVQEPVAAASDPAQLAAELAELPEDRRLAQSGDLGVFLAMAHEIPRLLPELGRLREITFRTVGEGTGKSLDLDRFDDYYWHLLLWNHSRRELVAAYRAGSTAEILPRHGAAGLYTSTLFRYDKSFFRSLGPALELGRSFVRPEYQRQHAPLLLLWKGIARLIAMHPELPVLFGAVSISNDYNRSSRELICRYFESRMHNDELAAWIAPRRPFRPRLLGGCDCRSLSQILRDVDDLSQPITDLEADGKGLPILLRQYARIGGRLLAFNLDRKFSNVLDGLVLVDLRRTEPAVLDRYMGRDAASRFREFHRAVSPA